MSIGDRVVLLAGGVGGAKLAVGLAAILPPSALTIIVNTADDFTHWGLYVSPDLDTVMYSLAGIANAETGWGLIGDTFQALDMMRQYGGPDWFRLGDKDIATSLLRTMGLNDGKTLTEITRQLASQLGVSYPILPMSDQLVRTILQTDQGEMAFQQYFVHAQWQPVVKAMRYAGIETAVTSPQVLDAFASATLIVFAPSNPYLSLDPILSLSSVRQAISNNPAPCIGVSPIIGGGAVKGPAAKLMLELNHEVSPLTIAKHYEDVLKGFILDSVDRGLIPSIENLNIRAVALSILMSSPNDKTRLATEILGWAQEQFH